VILVSDNGPQLTSSEFEEFCTNNGIIHRTCAVHKPASNGQAERVVQILKGAVKQAKLSNLNLETVIAKNMLVYRNTPHSTTGETPAKLLMGRNLRTRLDLIKPSVHSRVETSQEKIASRTANRGCRKLYCGDPILARNFGSGDKWMRGVVTEILGNKHYHIEVNGQIWKRHIDQLLNRQVPQGSEENVENKVIQNASSVIPNRFASTTSASVPARVSHPISVPAQNVPIQQTDSNMPSPESKSCTTPAKTNNSATNSEIETRYPVRERKPPSYLKDFAT